MLDLSQSKAATKSTFNGLSLIYIQSTDETGIIEVVVKSLGLKEGKIEIQTLPNNKYGSLGG